MMLLFLLFTVLKTVSPQAGEVHDFHLSRCQMVYSATDQALQITMHMFIDDLELALEKQGHQQLYITDEREHPAADSLLFNYLQRSIELTANGQALQYQFIGKEPSSDLQAVWCYLEVEQFVPPKEMTIHNALMLELYDDQKNIVTLKVPGVKGGHYLMEKGHQKEIIQFK